jgi:hypothetical protein
MMTSASRIGARAGVFSLVAMLCLGVACDDTADDMGSSETAAETTGDGDGDGDGDAGDGDGDAGLSYAADIQPIWNDNCIGCHRVGGDGELYLILTGESYGNIVGVLSVQADDAQLIEAGNAAESYLIAKLRGTHETFAGGEGDPMPSGDMAMPLPEETIMLIEQWTNEGVLP